MDLPDGEAAEACRQQALMAAIADARADAPHSPGLHAYRANARASAGRALGAAFPTVLALLGDADFAHLAAEFWRAHPPQRGDLGEWGQALAEWIDAHPGLGEWPYLGDCARLDLALHHCERAADALLDAPSLGLLSSAEPSHLRLHLLPGVQLLASRWPLASIHAAHAGDDEALFASARERVLQGQGEDVVVSRKGWRGVVHRIDAPGFAFMRAVLDAADLSQALDAAGDGFDFAAWLGDALRLQWLKEVRSVAD